ncbi:DUF5626 family protein [Desemzia sp. C1]|uniref:DUF5626 family protein n=1 Tax=Carnobacteriaceae TaxID=186828 RepID=UPI001E302C96|nr:DUF5626 family protein [Desemzia sp. C1]MCI3029502.1 DUF5626 family protein [Desemzia sp. C1]
MKKTVFILGCIMLVFVSLPTAKVHAEESHFSTEAPELIYDLAQGGTQTFERVSPEGEPLVIEVEEMPNSLRSVKNDTYKISASTAGQWQASYQIDVSQNKIIKAYAPAIVAYIGSFTSAILKVDHATQATYYLKRKVFLFTTTINLRAKVQSNKIAITY